MLTPFEYRSKFFSQLHFAISVVLITLHSQRLPFNDYSDQTMPQITIYRASWICPVDQLPVADGAVAVDQAQIVSVGRFADVANSVSCQRLIDLGDGAIVPGLINAHTHLEFSNLKQPLGHPGIRFTDWIRLIVAERNQSNQVTDGAAVSSAKSTALDRGMTESAEAGVWAIGEIATNPSRLDDYPTSDHEMALVCFLEQLGRDETLLPQKQDELSSFLGQSTEPRHKYTQLGASPHAPYSVGQKLLRQICSQSVESNRPVAMHLAETLLERELVEHQSGDFVSLLQDFGAWDQASFEQGLSIGETIEVLASAPRSLIVHGNFLSDSELDKIAQCSDRQSIVFCPRTHYFFQHSTYPLLKLLNRGINVCLGTDSRASNPDLNLFDEAKHVAASFPQIDPNIILRMATLNGATALGLEQNFGSLETGKVPALSFVSNPVAQSSHSISQWLFDQNSKCTRVMP